jgi:hypothetical protein
MYTSVQACVTAVDTRTVWPIVCMLLQLLYAAPLYTCGLYKPVTYERYQATATAVRKLDA